MAFGIDSGFPRGLFYDAVDGVDCASPELQIPSVIPAWETWKAVTSTGAKDAISVGNDEVRSYHDRSTMRCENTCQSGSYFALV